ncbi:MAG: GNAT family N-acetyltransferase [Deltaproteobacteria bacterium]|nr:GNAT family N-acetyltransferase [Deltaproteobacteria bacterium]
MLEIGSLMTDKHGRLCSHHISFILDTRLRKLIHNPRKILAPFIKEGMTVLDLGCGPGFFALEIVNLVGDNGKVIAADLQAEMLEKIKNKTQNTDKKKNITLHQCAMEKINITEKIDFALAFYMLHEVRPWADYLKEITRILKPGGHMLIAEPLLHVSKRKFESLLNESEKLGLSVVQRPRIFFSRSLLLKKRSADFGTITHMHFTQITYNSKLYHEEIMLRQEILRKPLGLDIHDEDLSCESKQLHFGMIDHDTLIACVVIVPQANKTAKGRQMAVSQSQQKKGIGQILIKEVEAELKKRGFDKIELHARKTAVGFYQKLGYSIVGDEFSEVTIPHYKMEKLMTSF